MPEMMLTIALAVLALSFTVVMLASARHQKLDLPKIDLRSRESLLRTLRVDGWLSRRRLVLTTHRVVLAESHWFLARVRTLAIPLEQLDGASVHHGMSLGWLIGGLAAFNVFAPAGVLGVLYALVRTPLVVRIGGGNHRQRFTMSVRAEQAAEAHVFVRAVQRQHGVVIGDGGAESNLDAPAPAVSGRRLAPETWVAVVSAMIVVAASRLIAGGLALDHAPVLALLSGLVAWTAARAGWKDGAAAGVFGMLGALAVLYPFPQLGILHGGAPPAPQVLLLAIVVAGAIGAITGQATEAARAPAAALSCLLWFLVAHVAEAGSAWTLELGAGIALAAAACALATTLPSPTWPKRVAATPEPIPLEMSAIGATAAEDLDLMLPPLQPRPIAPPSDDLL